MQNPPRILIMRAPLLRHFATILRNFWPEISTISRTTLLILDFCWLFLLLQPYKKLNEYLRARYCILWFKIKCEVWIPNRLVTVFLRKLEYYQGILPLTSNRGIQFDDAIISRVHLVIKYNNLSKKFRRDLWSTFLARARSVQGPSMTEECHLQRLERLELNGREVGSKHHVLIAC